jgi:anti-anti-sigma factor
MIISASSQPTTTVTPVRQHRAGSIGEDVPMSLSITVNGSLVELVGEIDLETAPALGIELTELINAAGPGTDLRLDLGAVSVLDSNGLSVLLIAHKQAVARDVRLLLGALPRHVERTLSITGLDEVLHIAG